MTCNIGNPKYTYSVLLARGVRGVQIIHSCCRKHLIDELKHCFVMNGRKDWFLQQLKLDSIKKPKQNTEMKRFNQEDLEMVIIRLRRKNYHENQVETTLERDVREENALGLSLLAHKKGPQRGRRKRKLLENEDVIANTIEIPEESYDVQESRQVKTVKTVEQLPTKIEADSGSATLPFSQFRKVFKDDEQYIYVKGIHAVKTVRSDRKDVKPGIPTHLVEYKNQD